MVTEKPRACNNLASEAAIIPLPREEVTPPVTNMYLVIEMCFVSSRLFDGLFCYGVQR